MNVKRWTVPALFAGLLMATGVEAEEEVWLHSIRLITNTWTGEETVEEEDVGFRAHREQSYEACRSQAKRLLRTAYRVAMRATTREVGEKGFTMYSFCTDRITGKQVQFKPTGGERIVREGWE